jgi:hypothetical protein
MIVQTQKDVYSMVIPPRYHKDLRKSLFEIQKATRTLILLPSDRTYHEFNDPIPLDGLPTDASSVVKIIGTRNNYKEACTDLANKVREIQNTQLVLKIPLKYQSVIHGQIRRKLAEINVNVSSSDEINDDPEAHTSLPANGSWQVTERYHRSNHGTCEWTLRAATKESLENAQVLINEAYQKARRAKYIGLLAFPDNKRFGLIVGKNGEMVQKLQNDTNTVIRVPKITEENYTIEITGSEEGLQQAKTRIEKLVDHDPPSPTDRLFRSSRTLSGSRVIP